jgi:geranylgeranyl diphosphate synthase type I
LVSLTDPVSVTSSLHRAEGFEEELERLERFLRDWIARSDREIQPLLNWQFLGRSKYFRPVTVFACRQAVSPGRIDRGTIRSACGSHR